MGGEAFGVVTRLGSAVAARRPELSVGAAVVCIPPDGMGSYLVTHERWVSRAEPAATPEEARAAVSATVAYATAWLALLWKGRVRKGESVLIHSAAGGVGLAALHLARRAGCSPIYATASTAAKRELLLGLGASQVFNSREPRAFSEGVRRATGGRGVHLVLNSLGGEAMRASLQLLRPGLGRMVELGKRDAYADAPLGLSPFLRGISLSAAHIDVLMLEEPEAAAELLAEVRAALPTLPPLPCTAFRMSELGAALEHMASGTHVGKIVIETDSVPLSPHVGAVMMATDTCQDEPLGRALLAASRAPRTQAAGSGLLRGLRVAGLRVAVLPAEADGFADFADFADIRLGAADEAPPDVVLPDVVLPDEALPDVVLARSARAAARAAELGVALVAELRGAPRALGSAQLRALLAHSGSLVVSRVAAAPPSSEALEPWLRAAVGALLGTGAAEEVSLDEPLEDLGFDSLMGITLAQQAAAHLGRAVSAASIQPDASLRQLLDLMGGGTGGADAAPPPTAPPLAAPPPVLRPRPRVLCIHGFRASAEMMAVQLAPFTALFAGPAAGPASVEFVFAQAPRRSTGPAQADIPPEVPTYEWWGEPGLSYGRRPLLPSLTQSYQVLGAQRDGLTGGAHPSPIGTRRRGTAGLTDSTARCAGCTSWRGPPASMASSASARVPPWRRSCARGGACSFRRSPLRPPAASTPPRPRDLPSTSSTQRRSTPLSAQRCSRAARWRGLPRPRSTRPATPCRATRRLWSAWLASSGRSCATRAEEGHSWD